MNLVNHDIYASNPLLGDSLFLTLNLPPQWQLGPGVSRPDIAANHERRHKTWVAIGSGWYVIYDEERRWALELAIHIGELPRKQIEFNSDLLSINGHPAKLSWKTRRRGLPWQRHDVTFMTVEYDCPLSERHVTLEFSGWCPRDGFDEVLEATRAVRCH